jgi:hypothetical protein
MDETPLKVAQPETYAPIRNKEGKYTDSVCSINPTTISTVGVRCPCGTKIVFNSRENFRTHTKTLRHCTWLEELNHEEPNYVDENKRLQALVESQQGTIHNMVQDTLALQLELDGLRQAVTKRDKYISDMVLQKTCPSTNITMSD